MTQRLTLKFLQNYILEKLLLIEKEQESIKLKNDEINSELMIVKKDNDIMHFNNQNMLKLLSETEFNTKKLIDFNKTYVEKNSYLSRPKIYIHEI